MSASPMREPHFAILLVAAWLLVVLELMLKFWPETAVTLHQPDDAMRLVQVREFLGGHSWFDLHMARLQPPFGYDPHWSRLVDAGLAGTFILFHQLTSAPFSERLMRAVWPVLWLLPVISGAAAIAWRLAKREAAILVLLFAVGGLPAMMQFTPGRIDHHNVQIAIAVLTVAATAWADRSRWAAAAAGILTGLGIGIGFEGVPFLAMCAAVFAVCYFQDKKAAGSVRAYGFSVVVSTIGAFIVNVSPDHWARTACDSIAINSATGVILGGFGLALITYSHDSRPSVRCGLIAAVAAAAALVFALSEPRCFSGPFAMVDPTVKQIWLRHVEEGQPMLSLLAERTATGLWLSIFPLVAVVAVIVLGLGWWLTTRSSGPDSGPPAAPPREVITPKEPPPGPLAAEPEAASTAAGEGVAAAEPTPAEAAAPSAGPRAASAPPVEPPAALQAPPEPVAVAVTPADLEVTHSGVGTGVESSRLVGRGDRFAEGDPVVFWTGSWEDDRATWCVTSGFTRGRRWALPTFPSAAPTGARTPAGSCPRARRDAGWSRRAPRGRGPGPAGVPLCRPGALSTGLQPWSGRACRIQLYVGEAGPRPPRPPGSRTRGGSSCHWAPVFSLSPWPSRSAWLPWQDRPPLHRRRRSWTPR